DPGRVARDKDELLTLILVDDQRRDPMGIDRTGAVELAPLDQQAAVVVKKPGAAFEVTRADLCQRIAKAVPAERQPVEIGALLWAASAAQDLKRIEMVRRDLRQRAVGGTDEGDGARQCHRGYTCTAVFGRYGDAPQARGRKRLELIPGQDAVAVAVRG